MMIANNTNKNKAQQSSILDFFKRKNSTTTTTATAAIENVNPNHINRKNDTNNNNNNHNRKRSLENNGGDGSDKDDDKNDKSIKRLATCTTVTTSSEAVVSSSSSSIVDESSSVLMTEIKFIHEEMLDLLIDCDGNDDDYTTTIDSPKQDSSIELLNEIKKKNERITDNDKTSSSSNHTKHGMPYVFANFRSILHTVLADTHHAPLFNTHDWNVIQEFTCLPGQAQHLYIKLYMRKRAWIPLSTIKYVEIDPHGEHRKELKILVDENFLYNSSKFKSVEEALNLMSITEFKSFIKQYPGVQYAGSKSKTISLFLTYIKNTRSVFGKSVNQQKSTTTTTIEESTLERIKSQFRNRCFKINEEKSKVFDRIFFLYHNPDYILERLAKQNDHQWIFGEFTIANSAYPVKQTNKQATIYSSREEFLEYCEAINLNSIILEKICAKDWNYVVNHCLPQAKSLFEQCFAKWHQKDAKLNTFLRKYSSTGMYIRAINECLAALERLKRYTDYLGLVQKVLLPQTIYGGNYRGWWYLRSVVIAQSHLKNVELALQMCKLGLEDDYIRGAKRLELFVRMLKMGKIYEHDPELRPQLESICPDHYCLNYPEYTITADYRNIVNDSSMKNFFTVTLANGDVNIMSVENVVINHYLKKGYTKGVHCESSIYHNLFGLLFWDIIYSPQYNDTFRYYQQLAPLDLNYDSFYQQRKEAIDARIQQISNYNDSQLMDELTVSWLRHHPTVSLLVDWEKVSLEDLLQIATCLTGAKIALICHLLTTDFKHHRSGFPDLIVWNGQTKQIKLIEVKGPTDHISHKQSICLSYLHHFGLDVELCHVRAKIPNE